MCGWVFFGCERKLGEDSVSDGLLVRCDGGRELMQVQMRGELGIRGGRRGS